MTDPSLADQADLARVARHLIRYSGAGGFLPFVVDRAAGRSCTDASGRAVLDFTSGQISAILGHAQPVGLEILDRAIADVTG